VKKKHIFHVTEGHIVNITIKMHREEQEKMQNLTGCLSTNFVPNNGC